MAKTKGRVSGLFLPGWDNEEHVSIVRNQDGELELRFSGTCGGCRESFPDMQRTIQTIAQKTAMTAAEATAFYLGFTVGVDSVRRYHRLGDFLDDDEVLEEFFGGKTVAGRFH
ncbi:MAG TPA: hypothetical protein VGC81_02600 [Candidatus Methylomirabilis sp.]|jgi:hypothetical protein